MKSDPLITYRRKPADIEREGLEAFAARLQHEVGKGREFHCRVSNDAELRELNARFRGKDYATDVLSFPGESRREYLGDIAISAQRARAQAREFGHSLDEELRVLLLHGLLHLLGMDHETDSGEMARAEKRWRKKLGLESSLTERAR